MKDENIIDLLKIGLTEGESKVYIALSEIGTSTVGPIVKKAGVAYSNIYEILNRLIEKGIVSFIIKKKTKYFQAASPKNLIDYLDKKEIRIQEQKTALKSVLPHLESLQKFKPQQDAEIFMGFKGLKTAYEKLLSGMEKGDENLFFYIHEKEYAEVSDRFYYTIKDLIKKSPTKGLSDEKYRTSKFIKESYIKDSPHIKIKFVDFPVPGNFEVCKNKIMLISWAKPIVAVLITSNLLADQFRSYFFSVWEQAHD